MGLPNYICQVPSQDTLTGPWVNAADPIASNASRHFPFEDSSGLSTKRFYHTIAPCSAPRSPP